MSTCSRTWEIEAARDGRLTGAQLEAHARHLQQCAHCRTESATLDALVRRLCETPVPELDALSQRRLREKLLEQVDADLTGRTEVDVGRRRRFAYVAAAAVVLMGLGLALSGSAAFKAAEAPMAATAASSSGAPIASDAVDVIDEGAGRWWRRRDGNIERVEINDGSVRLKITGTHANRVVVLVPDGEIEDVGTTFHVRVEGERTRRVAVDEGSVVVRLRGTEAVTLFAGDVWSAPVIGAASAEVQRPTMQKSTPAAAAPATNGSASVNGTPEDAAYLRVVRLLREHRNDEARAAARDYLRRFPDGFRREEMGTLAQSTPE